MTVLRTDKRAALKEPFIIQLRHHLHDMGFTCLVWSNVCLLYFPL